MHNILVREKGREMAEDDNHLELGTLLKRKVIPEEPPPSPLQVFLCYFAYPATPRSVSARPRQTA